MPRTKKSANVPNVVDTLKKSTVSLSSASSSFMLSDPCRFPNSIQRTATMVFRSHLVVDRYRPIKSGAGDLRTSGSSNRLPTPTLSYEPIHIQLRRLGAGRGLQHCNAKICAAFLFPFKAPRPWCLVSTPVHLSRILDPRLSHAELSSHWIFIPSSRFDI